MGFRQRRGCRWFRWCAIHMQAKRTGRGWDVKYVSWWERRRHSHYRLRDGHLTGCIRRQERTYHRFWSCETIGSVGSQRRKRFWERPHSSCVQRAFHRRIWTINKWGLGLNNIHMGFAWQSACWNNIWSSSLRWFFRLLTWTSSHWQLPRTRKFAVVWS